MGDNGGRCLPIGEAGGLLLTVAPPTMHRLTKISKVCKLVRDQRSMEENERLKCY